jgi:hypothetical protein
MESLDLLSTSEIAKGYNVLTDLELAIMRGSNEEQMNKLHARFYKYIPHKESSKMNLLQIYLKKAIMIGKLKDLSWTK